MNAPYTDVTSSLRVNLSVSIPRVNMSARRGLLDSADSAVYDSSKARLNLPVGLFEWV